MVVCVLLANEAMLRSCCWCSLVSELIRAFKSSFSSRKWSFTCLRASSEESERSAESSEYRMFLASFAKLLLLGQPLSPQFFL